MKLPTFNLYSSLRTSFHNIQDRRQNFVNLLGSIWSKVKDRVVPTNEGELGPELQSEIDDGLLYIGVRLKTFVNSVGKFVRISAWLTAVMLLIAMILVVLLVYFTNYLSDPVVAVILFPIGLAMVSAIAALGAANALLTLYLGALGWYGVKSMRKSPQIIPDSRSDTFSYEYLAQEESQESMIDGQIYQDNLVSLYRIVVYIPVIVLLFFLSWTLPKIKNWFANNPEHLQELNVDRIPGLGLVERFILVMNNLIPINIQELLALENAVVVLVVAGVLLIFAVFLNGKRVGQHAARSQFAWSDIEPYTWGDEIRRFWLVTKVILYVYLKGERRARYLDIRDTLKSSIWIFLMNLVLGAFFGYLILNSLL